MKRFALSDSVAGDLDSLIDTRLLVQANSGGGKSWCIRRVLEQTHGSVQHLVIDPEGEFATLREKYDYVLAARHGGDTAADPRTARLLAERLLELGVSAILDIYELKAHERVRFVREFIEALVDAPKKLWHPALVVVDEAHVFCPQKGEAESAGAVIDLAARGRKRGFCAVLATQRLSKLHKDAAAECNNKLIGRTGLDVDVKRAADELGLQKDRWRELRDLDAGEFFAFGPAISREVVKVKIGPVQTRHPKAGARLTAAAPAPSAKVKALLPKLSDLPAEVEERTKTTAELKARIQELTRELRARPTAEVDKVKVERVEVPVLREEDLRPLRNLATSLERLRAGADVTLEIANDRLHDLENRLREARLLELATSKHQSAPVAAAPRVTGSTGVRPNKTPASPPAEGMTGPEQRILDAAAWLEAIGVSPAQQTAVAFLAGYTIGGGAFNNPRGRLNQRGLIRYVGSDSIALTDEGRALAHAPDSALTPEELHERVLARLPGPEQKILRVLLEAYPESVPNDELATRSGYTPDGGAFNNPRGRLRSLGLIDYPERGRVVAQSLLFLEDGRA